MEFTVRIVIDIPQITKIGEKIVETLDSIKAELADLQAAVQAGVDGLTRIGDLVAQLEAGSVITQGDLDDLGQAVQNVKALQQQALDKESTIQ